MVSNAFRRKSYGGVDGEHMDVVIWKVTATHDKEADDDVKGG